MKAKRKVKIGTRLEGNFGAMWPILSGTVYKIDANGVAHYIAEATGENITVEAEDVKEPGTLSVNGSPIGVFFAKEK